MALTGTISLTNNFGGQTEISGAYVRVRELATDRMTALATVVVLEHEQGRVITELRVPFTPSYSDGAENHIRQAYEHMKTLDQFAAMEDA